MGISRGCTIDHYGIGQEYLFGIKIPKNKVFVYNILFRPLVIFYCGIDFFSRTSFIPN